MSRNVIETLIGAAVLVAAGGFLAFAYSSSGIGGHSGGYEVVGKFSQVDGLTVGADVRVSGVKIGTVISQELDPTSYLALVRLSINPNVQIPNDTVAVVASESLLGGRYMKLEPGGSEEMIPPGGELEYTQAMPGLEQLLGQFLFSSQGTENKPAAP